MDVQIECVCEGAPHPNDSVTLRERLDFRTVRAMRNEVRLLKSRDEEASTAEILATLTETYLLMGIESWSVVDAKGKPLLVSRASITERLFDANQEQAEIVGDAADELYNRVVLLPLVSQASSSSPPTPTNGSTSVTKRTPKPQKRSRPSSISITRTGVTGTTSTSLVGVSSYSQNSESAA